MSSLSNLTLGTAQLGMTYGIANNKGKPSTDHALNILDLAVQKGITCLDTSPVYGNSEEVVGRYLRQNQGALKVATKLPGLNASTNQTLNTLDETVSDHIHRSLKSLGINYIDYYLIHDEHDYVKHRLTLLKLIKRYTEEGRLGKVGLSVYSTEVALQAIEDGVEVLQIPCNIFDMQWENNGVIQKARNHGVTIFARSVYLQGLFFLISDEVNDWFPEVVPYLNKLQIISNEAGIAIPNLALAYVRSIEGISSLVIGVETAEQLVKNIELMQTPDLKDSIRQRIKGTFSDVPLKILNPSLWPAK